MIKHVPSASSISILDRLLEPVADCLSPDAARRLSELRADPATQALLDGLAEKAGEGQLSPEERREYESYVAAVNLIGVLQAKARRLLRDQAPQPTRDG